MKKLIKKMLILSSALGVIILLSGCTGCGQKKMRHQPKPAMQQQTTETVVFYQTYEDADINHVVAKMYTHSSHGGESRMGDIKFVETDEVYTAKIYQCNSCDSGMCCNKQPMQLELPTLSVKNAGHLKESFILHGLTAEQLNNAKKYLERDGGYKAAWGTLKKGMML